MKSLLLLLLTLLLSTLAFAQDRPQETRPAPSPSRQTEIRDSIRARSRVKFIERENEGPMKYQADRALLMPKMERTSIFRIGIPGFLMRLALRAGKGDFDSEEEFRAVRKLSKGVRSLRVAAFAENPAYEAKKLREDYERFIKRKKGEPVLFVRAPEGGVQIHVKQRRGKIKLITLMAYGDEGAAIVRLKSNFSEKHLKQALKLMTEAAEESAGVVIDTET
ncbi:MAG: DUF4252 domain-containing protein [Saprospiraceae bacterium]